MTLTHGKLRQNDSPHLGLGEREGSDVGNCLTRLSNFSVLSVSFLRVPCV